MMSESDVGIRAGDGKRDARRTAGASSDPIFARSAPRTVTAAPPIAPIAPDASIVSSVFTKHAPACRRRLGAIYDFRCVIREAAIAAPKPLSIFATVIPAAQLLSIVNSGAMP